MDNSIIPKRSAVSSDQRYRLYLNPKYKNVLLDDQIKAAVDAEDTCDVETGESEQPKKIVIESNSTESELALLFKYLSTGGTKPGSYS